VKINKIILPAVTILSIQVLLASCGTQPRTAPEVSAKPGVEAYLFDAELRRSGKPTSFRLEIFHADTVMALSGRGYLGKGALRGRVTPDSLLCYFPSSNEYLQEPVLNLLNAIECQVAPRGINLLELFDRLPDAGTLDSTIDVVPNYQNGKRPTFIIYVENCPWQMELTYRSDEMLGWRLDEFVFFDGQDTRLKATLREFKANASVKPDRFEVRIPSDATRIIP
jgi:hypothetical protein